MKKKKIVGAGIALTLTISNVTFAEAAPPSPSSTSNESYPKVGGHVGLAIPLVTIADPVTSIGSDYSIIGLAPGVTVKLNRRWSIDFEMVAYSNFWGTANVSSLVIDPGVIYNFDFASVGLRTAVHVGKEQNWGFIPIILKGFQLGDGPLSAFVELDLPVFFNEDGVAVTVQPQFGIGF